MQLVLLRDGPLEKLWGGGEGDFRAAGICFRYQIPCMNFFLGLTGVQDFFFIQFSLARIFFLYFARPPPISFLMVCPLYFLFTQ